MNKFLGTVGLSWFIALSPTASAGGFAERLTNESTSAIGDALLSAKVPEYTVSFLKTYPPIEERTWQFTGLKCSSESWLKRSPPILVEAKCQFTNQPDEGVRKTIVKITGNDAQQIYKGLEQLGLTSIDSVDVDQIECTRRFGGPGDILETSCLVIQIMNRDDQE